MRSSRANTSKETDAAELESKAFGFGVGMLGLAQRMKGILPDPVTNALAEHGANVGAHVLEAHAAPASQLQSYALARQSTRQAAYWLKLVHAAEPSIGPKLDELVRSAADLTTALKTASARARLRVETTKFR